MVKMIRQTLTDGSELSPEQIASIREAEKHPIVFSEDCPELTDEQLAEFRPANFVTWEERNQAMMEAGVVMKKELLVAGK